MRRSALSYRDFRLFFVGNLVSSTGTWLQNVAQAVLILQLTHRSLMVGVTQGATFVPVLFLALQGGRLADRFERRRLLFVTQVVAAGATGVLALLAATHRVGTAAVLAVAVVLGLQYAVAVPAAQALIPSLVPPEDLGPAVGLTSVTYNLARALGPLLATLAVALLGFGLAFGLNSLSFVVLAIAVLAIRPTPAPPRTDHGTAMESIRHAWRNRSLRYQLAVVAAVSFATDPVFTLSPALAVNAFHQRAADAGVLVSAFGGGAIVGAAALGRVLKRRGRARAIAGTATLTVLIGGMLGMAVAPSIGWAAASLAGAGVGYLLTLTAWTTGIQEAVDDALRGRVMAIWTLCFLGSRPIAAVADGAMADVFGVRVATMAMLVPLVLAGALLLPKGGGDRKADKGSAGPGPAAA